MLVTKSCRYCHGTGDYRGLYGQGKPDFKSKENICYHCDGTGYETREMNKCKYCGEPCMGYFCESCGNAFEAEREMEVEE